MRLNRRAALIGLVATGGGSYAAYELTDTFHPLSYSLDVPVMPSLDISEDAAPSVIAYVPQLAVDNTKGVQPKGTTSENVVSEKISQKLPESKRPELEKDQNQQTQTDQQVPAPPKAPTTEGEANTVQSDTATKHKLTEPVVSSANPTNPRGSSTSNPKNNQEKQRQEQTLEQLRQQHKSTASSIGLQVLNDYNAHGLESYSEGSATRVKTFVAGEDAGYMKDLWTNSIAIKHRKIWNLAPDEDPVWDKQLANAQKRFSRHGDGKTMYAWVFGNFTMDRAQEDKYQKYPGGVLGDINSYHHRPHMPLLDKFNLARTCKQNLARTPWGTWFSGGRTRYWILLWDFCAKPEWQEKGIPWDIDYWYRAWTGDRKQSEFK